MATKLVGLMAKYPEYGLVKTRLAKTVGREKTLVIYKNLLEHTIRQCTPRPGDGYQLCCFVTPPHLTGKFAEDFPELHGCFSQSDGSLGAKMNNAFEKLLEKTSARQIILIGADIPELNRSLILKAFDELDRSDVVWGPTTDGGYYLIGMNKQIHSELFEDQIPWGTDQVLSRSLEIAKNANIKYRLLPTLNDLDDGEDLQKFPEFNK